MGKTLSRVTQGRKSDPHPNDLQSNLIRRESDLNLYEHTYKEGQLLGEGITGCVKEVVSIKTGKRYAMKSINLEKIDKAQVKELRREIDILRQLDHPNIVRLHEVYENKNDIKIIMELLTGGDLSKRKYEEDEIRRIVHQLLSACRYWHARGIVHRDLKLENVLFSNENTDSDIKVIDFGLGSTFFSDEILEQQRRIRQQKEQSRKGGDLKGLTSSPSSPTAQPMAVMKPAALDGQPVQINTDIPPSIGSSSSASPSAKSTGGSPSENIGGAIVHKRRSSSSFGSPRRRLSSAAGPGPKQIAKSRIFQTTCGTAFYMPVEIIMGRGYDAKCDLWAIGVITYMLITRKPPFPGKNEREVFERVRRCNPSYRSRSWNRVSPLAMHFVKHLLTNNPTLRWSAEQALESPWLKGNGNLLRSISKNATSDAEFHAGIVQALRNFASYCKLKRAAMMIIAHNHGDFQNTYYNHSFLFIDRKKQGFITLDDLKAFLVRYEPSITDEEAQDIFNKMDQDRSGNIRYMEFLAASLETSGPTTLGMISTAFDHIMDKNGVITQKSMKKLLGKSFTKQEAADIIQEAVPKGGELRIPRGRFVDIMTTNHQVLNILESESEQDHDGGGASGIVVNEMIGSDILDLSKESFFSTYAGASEIYEDEEDDDDEENDLFEDPIALPDEPEVLMPPTPFSLDGGDELEDEMLNVDNLKVVDEIEENHVTLQGFSSSTSDLALFKEAQEKSTVVNTV